MTPLDRPRPSITLDPDSYSCPECGVIAVPCDDRLGRPVDTHVCGVVDLTDDPRPATGHAGDPGGTAR